MKYEEGKVDVVQATLVPYLGNTGGVGRWCESCDGRGLPRGETEVTLAHLNPSPWKTLLEEHKLPAGESL